MKLRCSIDLSVPAARERERRLEEALAEIERLRAAKKDNKDKEPQAPSSDAHGLITDVEVVNDPQDGQQIVPAMERLKQRWGHYPPHVE